MSQSMKTVLRAHEKELGDAWFDRMLASYPDQSRKYFGRVKQSFTNPVGANLYQSLNALLHELLADEPDADAVNEHVQLILRIKAVQNVLPSQAVSFVPALKQIIEETCGSELEKAGVGLDQYLDLYSDIDTVALYAFDSYSESRDLIYDMRLQQIRQTNDILVRAELVDKALSDDAFDMKDFMQCSNSLDGDCSSSDCSSCDAHCQKESSKEV